MSTEDLLKDSDQTETEDSYQNSWKLQTAERARLMGDNQKTLNRVNDEDRRRRDLQMRIEEAEAKVKHPGISDPALRQEEEMKISIDSPVTENHYYPPPVDSVAKDNTPKPEESKEKVVEKPEANEPLWKKALPYAAAAMIGAGGYGLAKPLVEEKPETVNPPVAVEASTDNDTLYVLGIGSD